MNQLSKQSGIALVMVLWFIALLSLLALGFSKTIRTDTMVARNLVGSTQAKHLAAAAVEKGIEGLLNLEPAVLSALISGAPIESSIGDARVGYILQDENGKLDINNAPVELIESLLLGLGHTQETARSLAHAIDDWRDEDDARHQHGAEQREYSAAEMSWMPSNAPFRSIQELRHVMGISADIYRNLAPLITVYGSSDKINPLYSAPALLKTIPDIDTAELENYIDARESLLAEEDPAALPLLTSVESFVSGQAGPVYTVFGRAELPSGMVATRRLVVWIPEQDLGRPYFVLDSGQEYPRPTGEDAE